MGRCGGCLRTGTLSSHLGHQHVLDARYGQGRYGANLKAPDLLKTNKVRPTSGIEFVSSRHFPDEVQGDILINNNIGYLGANSIR